MVLLLSENPLHWLSIEASYQYQYVTKVWVFDSNSKPVVSKFVSFPYRERLPRGLYTIRVEISGSVRDMDISLTKDSNYIITTNVHEADSNNILITPPLIYSSAPLYERGNNIYPSSHKYYTEPARELARGSTESLARQEQLESSLFIFFRYPSREKFRSIESSENLFSRYGIQDSRGTTLYVFDKSDFVETNFEEGWVSFNVTMTPGLYFIHFDGADARMVPVYVYRGWHTQVFMLLGKNPIYGSLRMFLSRQRQYDPYDQNNKIIDVLLNKLQNKDYTLNPALIRAIAQRKYESPMLGLLGAYVYLSSTSSKDDDLFNTILTNLQEQIMPDNQDSPDFQALRILAKRHFGDRYKILNTPIKGTPIFRIGYEAIRTASLEKSRLIKKNSINDLVTEQSLSDSPFNTFAPISIKLDEFRRKEENFYIPPTEQKLSEIGRIERIALHSIEDDPNTPPRKKRKTINTPIRETMSSDKFESLLYLVTENQPNINWLTYSIADVLKRKADLSIKQLSKELKVSSNTISRLISEFSKK